MTYQFPKANLLLVTDHAAALDIDILTLSLTGGVYTMTTEPAFPPEQLEHLEMVEVT